MKESDAAWSGITTRRRSMCMPVSFLVAISCLHEGAPPNLTRYASFVPLRWPLHALWLRKLLQHRPGVPLQQVAGDMSHTGWGGVLHPARETGGHAGPAPLPPALDPLRCRAPRARQHNPSVLPALLQPCYAKQKRWWAESAACVNTRRDECGCLVQPEHLLAALCSHSWAMADGMG